MALRPQEIYDRVVMRLSERYMRSLEAARQHQALLDIACEIRDLWLARPEEKYEEGETRPQAYVEMDVADASYWDCVRVNLHMGKHDSMTLDIAPIVESLDETLERCNRWKYTGSIEWVYRLPGTGLKRAPEFKLLVVVRASAHCKVVGTGEFVETKKVLCNGGKEIDF